jgi:hypothetical protein
MESHTHRGGDVRACPEGLEQVKCTSGSCYYFIRDLVELGKGLKVEVLSFTVEDLEWFITWIELRETKYTSERGGESIRDR